MLKVCCLMLALAALAGKANGKRMVNDLKASEMSDEAQFQFRAGIFVDDYELLERAGMHSLDPWPKGQLEDMSIRFGTNSTKLGTGSFGEVWKAKDKKTGQEVAIKLFMKTNQAMFNPKPVPGYYLRWSSAGIDEKQRLRQASNECDLVQLLANHSDMYPLGASHISKCLDNQVRTRTGTHALVYLVLQPGGDDLNDLMNEHSKLDAQAPKILDESRNVVVQILQALEFMQKFEPPVIHHDLKPGNVVYTRDSTGSIHIQIIDWGAHTFATEGKRKGTSMVYTPNYAPPLTKTFKKMTFEYPSHSFDVFSTGMIYFKFLCPRGSIENLVPATIDLQEPKDEASKSTAVAKFHSIWQAQGCLEVTTEEKALIMSMLGPAKDRPTPMKLLVNQILKLNSQSEASKSHGAQDGAPVATEFVNATSFFKFHGTKAEIHGKTYKCCCQSSTGECRLIDMGIPHEQCKKEYFWSKESCSCLVGQGWKSYKNRMLEECIVAAKDMPTA